MAVEGQTLRIVGAGGEDIGARRALESRDDAGEVLVRGGHAVRADEDRARRIDGEAHGLAEDAAARVIGDPHAAVDVHHDAAEIAEAAGPDFHRSHGGERMGAGRGGRREHRRDGEGEMGKHGRGDSQEGVQAAREIDGRPRAELGASGERVATGAARSDGHCAPPAGQTPDGRADPHPPGRPECGP